MSAYTAASNQGSKIMSKYFDTKPGSLERGVSAAQQTRNRNLQKGER